MDFAFTPEQDALRAELRSYFAGVMTPQRRADLTSGEGDYGGGGAYREIVRQLGADGWLTLGWPSEYGGQDRSLTDQLIFTDEAAAAGVPVPSCGPTSCPGSRAATCTSRSATPSRRRAPTWPGCARGRSATATTM
jgi:alkylation response protein AidB-like acyl-CoA dehydrogenase